MSETGEKEKEDKSWISGDSRMTPGFQSKHTSESMTPRSSSPLVIKESSWLNVVGLGQHEEYEERV